MEIIAVPDSAKSFDIFQVNLCMENELRRRIPKPQNLQFDDKIDPASPSSIFFFSTTVNNSFFSFLEF